MKFEGKVWKFGSDVDTDAIIPARYLNQTDAGELAKHVMEDERPEFIREVEKGDILVAKRNFGCGSSREHAPLALKAAGISCIIAESFARIFYRNGFNQGLPLLESLDASKEIQDGDRVQIDLTTGEILDLTQQKKFSAKPIPPFMQELIADGGLIPHLRKKSLKPNLSSPIAKRHPSFVQCEVKFQNPNRE
jgi:3-isopropylmalate/(R)-2-methylmalate dehydratase small subunit